MFVLPGWRHLVGFRMMLLGVCGYSRSDRSAQSASHDGTLATSDFVANGCTRRPANPATYCRLQS
jgi:hypothetical protein